MKKSIVKLAALIVVSATTFSSCQNPAQKVENAQENVNEAKEELNEANQEYMDDVADYRREVAEKIAINNQTIAEFNIRIESEKAELKEDYKRKIAALEQRNKEMDKRIGDYEPTGKEKWISFKSEFNRDMEELGQAFKDLTVKNNK